MHGPLCIRVISPRTGAYWFLNVNPNLVFFAYINGGGGGGGHSAHILVSVCHGKVENGGLRSGSSVKLVGLWSGLECEIGVLRSWLVGPVSLALWPAVTPGRWLAAVNWPWAATEWLEGKEMLKMVVSGAARNSKMVMIRSGFFFFLFYENDMLWSGNLGLKMGVLRNGT